MHQQNLLSIIATTSALLILGFITAAAYAQEIKSNSAQQQPKKASNKSKETISFKGISLGKQGVKPEAKDVLKKMCVENEYNVRNNWCSFEDDTTAFAFDYGSLPQSGGAVIH